MAQEPTDRHDIILLHLDGVGDSAQGLARGVQRGMASFGRMQLGVCNAPLRAMYCCRTVPCVPVTHR